MGCWTSTSWRALANRPRLNIGDDEGLYQSLGLKPKDVARIAAVFDKIDQNYTGSVKVHEMVDYLGCTSPMYIQRLFSVFDEDYNSQISFREFMIGCWNYCTVTDVSLAVFCFDLYDHDGSGEIELKEIMIMVAEIYGKHFESNASVKQMLNSLTAQVRKKDEFASAADIRLKINDFAEFCQCHPLLLQPAFSVQTDLRNKVGGHQFWRRCSKRRMTAANGTTSNAASILQSQVQNPKTHQSSQQELLVGTVASRRMSKSIKGQKVFKTPTHVRRYVQRITGELSPIVSPSAIKQRLTGRGGKSSKRSKKMRAQKIHAQ
jgi:Ca2+-binding EF-hand superfamily protein